MLPHTTFSMRPAKRQALGNAGRLPGKVVRRRHVISTPDWLGRHFASCETNQEKHHLREGESHGKRLTEIGALALIRRWTCKGPGVIRLKESRPIFGRWMPSDRRLLDVPISTFTGRLGGRDRHPGPNLSCRRRTPVTGHG